MLLTWGPINLECLNPRIASSLQERLGPRYVVSIGPTSLMRGDGGLALGFGGIAIRDFAGRPVLSAPSGRVGLDVWSLLRLEIKVHRLELDGLDLRLRVRPDGALSIAAAADADAATIDLPAPIPPDAESTAGPDFGLVAIGLIDAMTGASQSLDRVKLAHGHLEVLNEALGKRTVYDDFHLSFTKSGEAASISVGAKGPQGRWSLEAQARGGPERMVSLTAHDLDFDDIDSSTPTGRRSKPTCRYRCASKRTSGLIRRSKPCRAASRWAPAISSSTTPITSRSSSTKRPATSPGTRDAPLSIRQSATAVGRHPCLRGRLGVAADARAAGVDQPFRVGRHGIRAGAPGRKADHDPTGDVGRPLLRWAGAADARPSGGARPDRQRLGERRDGDGSRRDHPQGRSSDRPERVVDLLRLWPSFINADARAWCIQNIHGGQLLSASMKVDWDAAAFDLAAHNKAVPADSVLGEMTARDVVVDMMPGLPPLTVADASARVTGRVFSANAKTGVVELSPTRRIMASDIVYQVPDTSPAAVVPAKANAHLQGGADALVDLLGRDALKHYAGFTLDPALVKGQFEGDLAIDLKLGKSVRPEDQQFRANGTLANLRVDKFLANERLEQGALTVDARQGATKITGQGQIYGVPVTIDAAKGATDEGAITLALSSTARPAPGSAFPSPRC